MFAFSMSISSYLIYLFLSQLFIFKLVVCKCSKEFKSKAQTLSFPFTKRNEPNCGLLLVDCDDTGGGRFQQYPKIQILSEGNWYIFNQGNSTGWIVPNFTTTGNCGMFNNFTLPKDNPAISFSTTLRNVTMLKCNSNSNTQRLHNLGYQNFSECRKEHDFNIYYNYSNGLISDPDRNNYPSGCSIIQWPTGTRTFDQRYEEQMFSLLDAGVPFNWTLYGSCKDCYVNGQRCRVDTNNYTCTEEDDDKLGLIFGSVLGGVVLILLICLVICHSATRVWCLRSHCLLNHLIFLGSKKLDHKNIEKFLKNNESLGPRRYNYSDIKRMTSSFKHKIGQGGFGSVFKGCSADGSPIAVKLLNDSRGNGEEFMNEVASISRTSHVNIVKLYGYCFEDNKRALVYGFMPKGSLEKFIFDGNNQLGMQELFKIAIGIARGLEYLHQLCATRIVHFDVKPHNILLDEDFTPKISDFGLAKSSPQEYNTIISLSAARGTIGYMAPEVVCRYIGNVSHKSDVYSYGMMVLEIVGGRRNVDNGVDNSSQMYMPHWIYNQIETNQDADFLSIGNDQDDQVARKMNIVSFWCIQTDPSSRPTMTRVVEMLESKLESLQIPPRPYLFSAANTSPSTVQIA